MKAAILWGLEPASARADWGDTPLVTKVVRADGTELLLGGLFTRAAGDAVRRALERERVVRGAVPWAVARRSGSPRDAVCQCVSLGGP